MHLSEGVLTLPVLAGCWALAAAGTAIGLKRLPDEKLPLAAVLGALFFVASTLHLPVGLGSVHLVLNGLVGLLLGWAVFPVLLVALALQALLLGFGGLAVLGANVLLMAGPGLLAHLLLRRWLGRGGARGATACGAFSAVIGIGGAALLAMALLLLAGGRSFERLALLIGAAHLPVLLAEAVIGALALRALAARAPGWLIAAGTRLADAAQPAAPVEPAATHPAKRA